MQIQMFKLAKRLAKSALAYRHFGSEDDMLLAFARTHRNVFFIQIGAHDGKTDDSLFNLISRYGWSGVLVEPVPYLFNRLVKNHAGHPCLHFENSAIARNDGTTSFFCLRETDDHLPHWYDQLGSMNRDHILSHEQYIPTIKDYLIEEKVNCISFETLLRRHAIQGRIDLILIDTEGSDLEVLSQIDLKGHQVQFVVYEWVHLSANDKNAAILLLKKQGYSVFSCGGNNVAVPSHSIRWWERWLNQKIRAEL
jgi:FkbM family methyltransferase